jgi:hypothetical protein
VTDSIQDQLIADLAHDLVAQTAPQELPLFKATSEAYLSKLEKPTQGRAEEDMLAFGPGAELTFLTPAALVVASEVVGFLTAGIRKSLEKETSEAVSGLVKKMFKKMRGVESKMDVEVPPPLTSMQTVEVRKLVFAKARQLNLSEAQAALLADAVVGTLVIARS